MNWLVKDGEQAQPSDISVAAALVGMLLLLPHLLGADGIWLAVPAAEGLGVLVSVSFLIWGRKKYRY